MWLILRKDGEKLKAGAEKIRSPKICSFIDGQIYNAHSTLAIIGSNNPPPLLLRICTASSEFALDAPNLSLIFLSFHLRTKCKFGGCGANAEQKGWGVVAANRTGALSI
jgi:hypothetical protein